MFDEIEFMYAPDEPAAGASTPEVTSQDTSVTADTSTQTPVETPASTPSAEGTAGTTTPAVASAPASPAPSWLDGFRSDGISFENENQARQALAQSYRDAERLRPLAPVLSQYQQYQAEFQTYLAERQKQAQAQQAKEDWTKKLGWNHPEWDPSWVHQIVKDDKGNLTAAPGAPADVVLKYQQAQQFRQKFIDDFLTNPAKAMEPYIRHIAQESAQQYANQNVSQYREQQEANQFIDEHKTWLFNKSPDGTVQTRDVINPQTGIYEKERVLSNWGRLFVDKLQTAARNGYSPKDQQEYALQAVQVAYMSTPEYIKWAASQLNPQAAAAPVDPRTAANAAFIDKANPAKPPAAAKPSGNAKSAPRTVNRDNLEQIMLERFREEGVQV